jgi:3',5'-cyclic AMP phosphodiesterase CpdA
VIVDSTQVENSDQLAWLGSSLSGSTSTTIVSMHHPAYSCSTHGGRLSVQELWVPLFGQNRVELVLAGHDHNYQRFTDAGVTYVVSGGGGQSIHALKDCSADHPQRLSGAETHHFLVITQLAGGLQVEAVAAGTGSLDQFQISTVP